MNQIGRAVCGLRFDNPERIIADLGPTFRDLSIGTLRLPCCCLARNQVAPRGNAPPRRSATSGADPLAAGRDSCAVVSVVSRMVHGAGVCRVPRLPAPRGAARARGDADGRRVPCERVQPSRGRSRPRFRHVNSVVGDSVPPRAHSLTARSQVHVTMWALTLPSDACGRVRHLLSDTHTPQHRADTPQ